jgi:hypothetical protein
MTPTERFWSYIAKAGADECWPHTGTGLINWDGVQTSKRRVAWIVSHGKIRKGLMVLAKCGSVACCNPKHLFIGDAKARGALTVARGHSTAGARSTHAKLTTEQVQYIRDHYRKTSARHGNGSEIARHLGISPSTVHHIGRGETWRNA